ncbi:adenosine deaminase family protein [Streptomyces sp. MUM 178J]|uniref:adenosine deaminase family protein n=1 Tax=Streptomyces sp. MUM 178J TaxID=2791991 RepID=UPI001F039259|nr:adenosine deaminase [Streptomyces sp. MUM 178J]WRQ82354.1 adenosine deaminase [Streptomyces sp. MUM 178J]
MGFSRTDRRLVLPACGLAVAALLPAAPATATATEHPHPHPLPHAHPHPLPHAHPHPRPRPVTPAERRVDAYLKRVQDRPQALRNFFRAMPKGGELHSHLVGAATTELLIRIAGEDRLCIEEGTLTAVPPPCDAPGSRPAADARTDAAFHRVLLRAWSMQDFPAGAPTGQSGHDHFFATFGKFGAVLKGNGGRLLAEVARSLVDHNQLYLETMVNPASDGAAALAAEVGWDPELRRLHRTLLAEGRMDRLVARARAEADAEAAQFRRVARCDTARPQPRACRLPVRYVYQVLRETPPEQVFTQMLLGMRLAEADPRFVAVNLVQPEDGEIALRDYRLHMRMLRLLRRVHPGVRLTLHAGELVPGLVKPEHLRFHIREAVLTAGAERIGHGVDLQYEDDWRQLARTMAERRVAVEAPLTSNEQILGVAGEDHSFDAYRAYGVPVVLATDDPGVSRTDVSHEYQRAARTYALSYPELKDLARASLEHAFLPGRSLWQDPAPYRMAGVCRAPGPRVFAPPPSAACAGFLDASPKAALQWRLERAFADFEASLS